ncbi:MAG: hypothetical protein ACK4VI_00195 [Alphaproteobacteria bacterium]
MAETHQHNHDHSHSHSHNHNHDHGHGHAHSGKPVNQKLGLSGYLTINPRLREAAVQFGIHIEPSTQRSGHYVIHSAHGRNALEQIVTPLLNKLMIAEDGKAEIDTKTLKSILSFLHQPLKFSASQALEVQGQRPNKSDRAKIEAERRIAHQVLRFAVTGTPDIPKFVDEHVHEHATAECHSHTEDAMKDDDMWALESELANPQSHGEHDHITSAIPHTHYDPDRGFVFKISNMIQNSDMLDGAGQNALQRDFWELVNAATKNRYKDDPKPVEIAMNAQEILRFSKALNARSSQPDFLKTLDQASFEHKVQAAFSDISNDARKLTGDLNFLLAAHKKNAAVDQKDTLVKLLATGTMLQPIVNSETMRKLHAHYFFTGHVLGQESPVDAVASEMAVFQAVLLDYAKRDTITAPEMQAISNRFAHILSFSQSVTEAITSALDNSIASQKTSADTKTKLGSLKQIFQDSHDALSAPAIVGASRLADHHLDDEMRDLSQTIKKALKYDPKGMASELGNGFLGALQNWYGTLIDFATESPKAFLAYSAILAYIVMNAPDSETMGAIIREDLPLDFGDGNSFAIPAEFLQALDEHVDHIFAEAGEDRSCHLDQIGFYTIKHCISQGVIAGNAKTAIGILPFGDQFMGSANSAAERVADVFFDLNLIQNLSHGAFWGYTLKKGLQRGLVGGKSIIELVAPLSDPIAAGVSNLSRRIGNGMRFLTGGEMRPDLEAAMTRHILVSQAQIRGGKINTTHYMRYNSLEPVSAQYSAAIEEALAAASLSEQKQSAYDGDDFSHELTLKTGWLTKTFTLSHNNITPLTNALRELNVTLAYIGDKIGIEEEWQRKDLQTRLDIALVALEEFKEHKDSKILQSKLADNLDRLIGAQLSHTGASDIDSVLFADDAQTSQESKTRQDTLKRFYDRWASHMDKMHNIEESYEKSASIRNNRTQSAFSKNVDLAWQAAGRGTWRTWDYVVRGFHTGSEAVKLTPYKKQALTIGAAFLAAGVGYEAIGGIQAIQETTMNSVFNAASSIAGGIAGTGVTSTIALAYNFVEDVVAVHVASGLAFLATGAGLSLAFKYGAEPVNAYIAEKTSFNPVKKLTGWLGLATSPYSHTHAEHKTEHSCCHDHSHEHHDRH